MNKTYEIAIFISKYLYFAEIIKIATMFIKTNFLFIKIKSISVFPAKLLISSKNS